jgi:hypothetical protein
LGGGALLVAMMKDEVYPAKSMTSSIVLPPKCEYFDFFPQTVASTFDRVARFFLAQYTKTGKIYHNIAKWP